MLVHIMSPVLCRALYIVRTQEIFLRECMNEFNKSPNVSFPVRNLTSVREATLYLNRSVSQEQLSF